MYLCCNIENMGQFLYTAWVSVVVVAMLHFCFSSVFFLQVSACG